MTTDQPTDRDADEQVPGETTTGARPGGREGSDSPTPGGAVTGEIGRVHGVPGEADPVGDADLGTAADGDGVADMAERVREADATLDEDR
jgi:hypothetical protein